MAKPSPLQVRNILVALLAAGAVVWNVVRGGPWFLNPIFAAGCALAITSAVINRPRSNG